MRLTQQIACWPASYETPRKPLMRSEGAPTQFGSPSETRIYDFGVQAEVTSAASNAGGTCLKQA
jgi:hypothetical protein